MDSLIEQENKQHSQNEGECNTEIKGLKPKEADLKVSFYVDVIHTRLKFHPICHLTFLVFSVLASSFFMSDFKLKTQTDERFSNFER